MVTRPVRPPLGARASLAATLLIAACSRPAPPDRAHELPQAPAAQANPTPGFANRAWKVGKSSAVELGTYYVFLSDGTLLITSAHGTPSLGRWRFASDTLTLVEEGIAHPAVVVKEEAEELAIRIPGPGEPLEITFVPVVTP